MNYQGSILRDAKYYQLNTDIKVKGATCLNNQIKYLQKQSNQVLTKTVKRYITLTNTLHAQFAQSVLSTIDVKFLYTRVVPALANVNIALQEHPDEAAAIKSRIAKHFFANTLLNKVVDQKEPQYDLVLLNLVPKYVNDETHSLLQANKVTRVEIPFEI